MHKPRPDPTLGGALLPHLTPRRGAVAPPQPTYARACPLCSPLQSTRLPKCLPTYPFPSASRGGPACARRRGCLSLLSAATATAALNVFYTSQLPARRAGSPHSLATPAAFILFLLVEHAASAEALEAGAKVPRLCCIALPHARTTSHCLSKSLPPAHAYDSALHTPHVIYWPPLG